MRFILGIIIGCVLTIGGAYVADRFSAAAAQPVMVNWDVVAADWNTLKTRAHDDWVKISSK